MIQKPRFRIEKKPGSESSDIQLLNVYITVELKVRELVFNEEELSWEMAN